MFLVLQNSKIEGPGILGNLLESDGFTIRTIYAKQESTKRNFRIVINNFDKFCKEKFDDRNSEEINQENLTLKGVERTLSL